MDKYTYHIGKIKNEEETNQAIEIFKSAFENKIGRVFGKGKFANFIYKSIIKDEDTIYMKREEKIVCIVHYKFKKDIFKIQTISVSKEFRGQGVGTKMLDYIEDFASKNNMHKMKLEVIEPNINAKKLYEKYGFQTTKKRDIFPLNILLRQKFRYFYQMEKIITNKN